MCQTCGCNITEGNQAIAQETHATEVLENLLQANDHQADHNRAHFDAQGILAINLMSSPGAGKTRLLEETIKLLKDKYNILVIEGDLATENDAERIRAQGVEAIQIATGNACHLDAHLVHNALHDVNLENIDIVFIENVGNLVCPASFDLGHHYNVTLLSVTEGDDKPQKYPVMFRAADLVLLTKSDFLSFIEDFSCDKAERYVRELANEAPVFAISAAKNENMDKWLSWLENSLLVQRARVKQGQTRLPKMSGNKAEIQAIHSHDHDHTHDHTHHHHHHQDNTHEH